MANITSVKSGYWSDPTTWDLGVVPADGDTVTIASGHTVIFNVDQTSFTNGLAGLTINGTLRFPSQSEDANMPQFVHLKVNANIAGTGSLLVGSSTYPITHPQQVKISVNGTITTATVNMYGEQRRPCFDYLAQDAASGATTIVLTEGMPLRAGDIIAIGRSDSWHWTTGEVLTHTVTAYDPSTKTVTISPALTVARSGTYPYNCLVILLTRQIHLEKYGSNNVNIMSGSGRYLQGIMWSLASGASGSGLNVSSTEITDCSYRTIGIAGSNLTIRYASITQISVFYTITGNNTIENLAGINYSLGWAGWSSGTYSTNTTINNIHVQNFGRGLNIYGTINGSITVNNLTIKNSGGVFRPEGGRFILSATNILVVNTQIEEYVGGEYKIIVNNLTGYYSSADPRISNTALSGIWQLQNVTINLSNRTFSVGNALNIFVDGLTIQGTGTANLSAGGRLLRNVTINVTPANPLGYLQQPTKITNLSVPTYNRPRVYTRILNNELHFAEILGLTVAGTVYSQAFERIWDYGWVQNGWDETPPNYNKLKFYITDASTTRRLYLDYRTRGDNPITVTGNITQLANGDTVKVQIFRADKEPLLGDTPDYEQTYTATGAINVNWTPPSAEEWIVRVSVTMRQTSTPTTIANLEVGGSTTGEPSFVWIG